MCIYDLATLKPRLKEGADWWTLPEAEVGEANRGNALFIGLGDDGDYEVTLVDELPSFQLSLNLRCPSGRLFIGAAEEVTGDGLEPEALRGGKFLDVAPGNYLVLLTRGPHGIDLKIEPGGEGVNRLNEPVRLA